MGSTSWIAGLAMLAAATGCSAAPDHPEALEGNGGHDSGVPIYDGGRIRDTGVPDTHVCANGGDAGCNALELCGPEVSISNLSSAAPMQTGGTIVDGNYVLKSMTFYQLGAQPLSGTQRQALQITGAASPPMTIQQISQAQGAAAATLTWSVAVMAPSTLDWTGSCPPGMQGFQLTYT